MKSILQILRGLTLGLPASVSALLQWLCAVIHRRIRPGTDRGGVATLEWLARGQRSALLVFASPACGQCATLLPAVAKLQEDAGEHLRAAVISSGDLESSRRMFGGCAIKIAATDGKGQAARLFRIPGIPSAVLIGPERTIASETVVGAQAVMNLLNQLARTGTLAARVTRHPRSGDAESPTPMVVVRT